MHLLVTYDVSTETKAGRKRLKAVAQGCKNYGQRVQKSVFECSVDDIEKERMIQILTKIIDKQEDSLRVYRLMEPVKEHVQVFGWEKTVDYQDTLVV